MVFRVATLEQPSRLCRPNVKSSWPNEVQRLTLFDTSETENFRDSPRAIKMDLENAIPFLFSLRLFGTSRMHREAIDSTAAVRVRWWLLRLKSKYSAWFIASSIKQCYLCIVPFTNNRDINYATCLFVSLISGIAAIHFERSRKRTRTPNIVSRINWFSSWPLLDVYVSFSSFWRYVSFSSQKNSSANAFPRIRCSSAWHFDGERKSLIDVPLKISIKLARNNVFICARTWRRSFEIISVIYFPLAANEFAIDSRGTNVSFDAIIVYAFCSHIEPSLRSRARQELSRCNGTFSELESTEGLGMGNQGWTTIISDI